MLLVLLIAALIWFVGGYFHLPKPVRASLVAVLYLAVLCVYLVFAQDHALRINLGGNLGSWILFGTVVLAFVGYRKVLHVLRARAAPEIEGRKANDPSRFSETELDRYARHIVLREIGGPGQKALKKAKVLVIGAGGLGAPVLQYLAAAGVGTIGVIDDDVVDNSNLQRQIIHPDAAIGMPKVFSAQQQMLAQNPFVQVKPYHRRLNADLAAELIAEFDLVLDGTDNFATRYLVNKACVDTQTPLISGALSQWEGQLSVFSPSRGAPCYQCVFPNAPAAHLAPSCAEAGVLGPLPGVVGSMMAVEAIKLITGAGTAALGQLVIYDALYGESRSIQISPRADCPVCGE